MPKRYNLTKFDVLSNAIHKLSVKDSSMESKRDTRNADAYKFSDEDNLLKAEAIIIASFSSGHSWKTYNALTNRSIELNSDEVKSDYKEAEKEKWKSISESDIKEILNLRISDNLFMQWLFFNVDKDEREIYKKAWGKIKEEFEEMCD
ncbi:hypothetical protein Mia14_0567 [Candidatus Mancarchaeum acidiphilum]|uniref:Uncharacterized protein n=1 Tax=Candidatus Mancarchaeum acidiphilum TaxID=1920749 RepID=A0A218NN28_9ARCH|nr:hypothetical protein [Candidatus Mancarchaeum acidiphilum]ASI13876.1 hypothetical protein Mia14_0567 [Candidatus Mancarchaeum acidiphilum]